MVRLQVAFQYIVDCVDGHGVICHVVTEQHPILFVPALDACRCWLLGPVEANRGCGHEAFALVLVRMRIRAIY